MPVAVPVLLVGIGWPPSAGGQEAKDAPGIQVGEKAPPFTLKDQGGKERSLDDLLKGGPVALVFYRSASW
jgi:cytochrome oxidase Cu insertion factor (SCO1/SenC/PrrC family)